MKVTLFTVLGAAAVSGVWAQDNVSATRSDACEPHGDHWYVYIPPSFLSNSLFLFQSSSSIYPITIFLPTS